MDGIKKPINQIVGIKLIIIDWYILEEKGTERRYNNREIDDSII
jgi:hypothetical protein